MLCTDLDHRRTRLVGKQVSVLVKSKSKASRRTSPACAPASNQPPMAAALIDSWPQSSTGKQQIFKRRLFDAVSVWRGMYGTMCGPGMVHQVFSDRFTCPRRSSSEPRCYVLLISACPSTLFHSWEQMMQLMGV